MGEYEPNDSRDGTQSQHRAPGEPPRTGPREGEARRQSQQQQQQQAGETELDQDERGEDVEGTPSVGDGADAQAEQELREAAMEQDADELDAGEAGRLDRND